MKRRQHPAHMTQSTLKLTNVVVTLGGQTVRIRMEFEHGRFFKNDLKIDRLANYVSLIDYIVRFIPK